MKIMQSAVSLQSQHLDLGVRSQQTSLRTWVGARRPDFEGRSTPDRADKLGTLAPSVMLSLSAASRAAMAKLAPLGSGLQAPLGSVSSAAATQAVSDSADAVSSDPRMQLLIQIIEALTGQAVQVFDARQLQGQAAPTQPAGPTPTGAKAATAARGAPAGWGLEYDRTESVHELEQTQVSAQGLVRTADGQEIRFVTQLTMQREFTQQTQTSLRLGDAARIDPLVLNFNGSAAQLSDTRFSFDLNADGQADSIAMPMAGTGFLALDKNQDGRINDGSELFGPASGDGFADLARYDSDGNHWIDANDPIFAQLRIWQPQENGQDQLGTLAEHGVGALYLGQVASPFAIRDANNQGLGQVRNSGLFLYESGQLGSMQQIDL